MTFEEKLMPVFIPGLVGYQMKMHRDSGEHYCFTLTGLKAYSPNTGSRCGCGSDEWCFHCKYNGEHYILRFADDSGYGTYWDCTLVSKENAEQLEKMSVIEWLTLQYKAVKITLTPKSLVYIRMPSMQQKISYRILRHDVAQ